VSRWIAALPLVVMAPLYVLFVIGIMQGGDNNLAWVLPILSSPPALLYVVVVAFFLFLSGRKQGSSQLSSKR
jgi:Flp pilus assembly protein protease CpaA